MLHHEIEVADDSATLYLTGALCAADAAALTQVCEAMPPRVVTLRLDMHGVVDMADDAMGAIRSVLRYWRESRGGSFRLSLASERIVATYGEGSFATSAPGRRSALARAVDSAPALTAMYL